MQIEEMTEEIYSALHDVWEKNAERRSDWMRDPDILDYFLFQDGGATTIHAVDGTPAVLMIGNVEEGLNATVLLVNPSEAEPGQILRELLSVMSNLSLKRLTAHVPGPVKDVQGVFKEMGFRREGHLRRAAYWNGRLCGIDVYGLYKDAPRGQPRKEPSVEETHASQEDEKEVVAT